KRLGGSASSDRLYFALMSCHRSGYVREMAIRELYSDSPGLSIPFLLLRLVDWVPAVATAAAARLLGRLQIESAETIIDCLGLVDRLSSNSRWQTAFTDWIDQLLGSPAAAESLRRGLAGPSRAVRRFCFRVAAKNPALLKKDIVYQAL